MSKSSFHHKHKPPALFLPEPRHSTVTLDLYLNLYFKFANSLFWNRVSIKKTSWGFSFFRSLARPQTARGLPNPLQFQLIAFIGIGGVGQPTPAIPMSFFGIHLFKSSYDVSQFLSQKELKCRSKSKGCSSLEMHFKIRRALSNLHGPDFSTYSMSLFELNLKRKRFLLRSCTSTACFSF